ncbi:hypothetical protein T484DRAFT_1791910 [Baffinella frigidus]|nr:hypothetical protein T484DRAFT_1791910 [Cryptophyta sp. CCMP2293]
MPQGAQGGGVQPGRVAGILGGVGVVFQAGASGEGLTVASLAIDGPAGKSGQVEAGDVLVSIDDVDVRGKSAEGLAQFILGPPGSKVVLGFVRNAPPARYVQLTRGSNPLPPNHALVPGSLAPQ